MALTPVSSNDTLPHDQVFPGSRHGSGFQRRKSERLRGEIEVLKKIVNQVKGIELIVESEKEAMLRM